MSTSHIYRNWINAEGLTPFKVIVGQTDMLILAESDISSKAITLVNRSRSIIEEYITGHPDFGTSLVPLPFDRKAAPLIRRMHVCSRKAGVGPMATVAGAIAQFTAVNLLKYSPELIVENGGDIYLILKRDRTVAIFAGGSPLSGKIGLCVRSSSTPLGICTSSGTFGHSLSFGRADAAVAVCRSAVMADAAATAIANSVTSEREIEAGLAKARSIPGVKGALIIVGSKFGVWGKVELKLLE